MTLRRLETPGTRRCNLIRLLFVLVADTRWVPAEPDPVVRTQEFRGELSMRSRAELEVLAQDLTLTGFRSSQVSVVRDYVSGLSSGQQAAISRVGF